MNAKLRISDEFLKPLSELFEKANFEEDRLKVIHHDARTDYMRIVIAADGFNHEVSVEVSANDAEDMLDEVLRIPAFNSDREHPNYTYFRGLSSY